jgi:hypothetical protein
MASLEATVPYVDESTADFITETPQEGFSYSPLKDYGSYTWTNAVVTDSSGNLETIGAASNPTKLTMVSKESGDVLSIASALNGSGSGFTSTWEACS